MFDNLLQIAVLKAMCHAAYFSELKQKEGEVWLTLYPKAKIKTELLQEFLKEQKNALKFVMGKSPYFIFRLPRKEKPLPPKAEADWMFGLLKRLLQDFMVLVDA